MTPETTSERPLEQWGCFEEPRTIHVLKFSEIKQHETDGLLCPCGPRIECYENGRTVIHARIH